MNAGHMSPMIRKPDGTVEEFTEDTVGVPIGVVEDYPCDAVTRALNPGETSHRPRSHAPGTSGRIFDGLADFPEDGRARGSTRSSVLPGACGRDLARSQRPSPTRIDDDLQPAWRARWPCRLSTGPRCCWRRTATLIPVPRRRPAHAGAGGTYRGPARRAAGGRCEGELPGPAFRRIWAARPRRQTLCAAEAARMRRDADRMKEELRHLNTMARLDFKISNDLRVTWLGRLLRKYSLDERCSSTTCCGAR